MTVSESPPIRDATGPVDDTLLAELRGLVTTAGEREPYTVEAPFTGERVATVPKCTAEDVELAVSRAREAQAEWAERSVEERAELVRSFRSRLLDERETFLDLIQLETGKSRRTAFEEVQAVALTAGHYAHRAEQYLGRERRKGPIPRVTEAEVNRVPVGVCGLISPWNYPLELAVSDSLPALLAGNAVVLKPAERTSHVALYAKRLLEEVGLPADLFSVVTGLGPDVGPALVERVDYVGFTGSSETGRVVAEQAGRNLVKCSLELGGKNPALVFPDADLDRAVPGLVHGTFNNAGQLCISIERLYVHEAVYEEFLDRFVAASEGVTMGAGYDFGYEMGSLASADQLEKVESHVEDARSRGATVHCGGRPRPDLGPYYYEPTVLTGVERDTELRCSETFGPVVSIYPFSGTDEAVEAANDTEYGLNASVWTEDVEFGKRVARRVRAGTVNVNDAYGTAYASVDAPMGGMGDSGIGRRHGREGIEKYTEAQTVAVQHGRGMDAPDGVPYWLYARVMTGALRLFDKVPGLR